MGRISSPSGVVRISARSKNATRWVGLCRRMVTPFSPAASVRCALTCSGTRGIQFSAVMSAQLTCFEFERPVVRRITKIIPLLGLPVHVSARTAP